LYTAPGSINYVSQLLILFLVILVDRVKKQSEDDCGGLTDNESGSGEYLHAPFEQGIEIVVVIVL
jgi:hypothetical protein